MLLFSNFHFSYELILAIGLLLHTDLYVVFLNSLSVKVGKSLGRIPPPPRSHGHEKSIRHIRLPPP